MIYQFKNGTIGYLDPIGDYGLSWVDWYAAWDRSLGSWVYYER